jgi:hypothetical protein
MTSHEQDPARRDLGGDCGARRRRLRRAGALARGETIQRRAWLVIAGVCTYLVAYRFYSRYLAYTVFGSTIGAPHRRSG